MPALRAHISLAAGAQRGDIGIAKAHALPSAELLGAQFRPIASGDFVLGPDDLEHLRQEPGVDKAELVDLIDAPAATQRLTDLVQALAGGHGDGVLQLVVVQVARARRTQRVMLGFQRAQGLVERFGKIAANRHNLAHRAHLGVEFVFAMGEFLEGEFGYFGYHVVQGRLEGGWDKPAGDLVGKFVQAIADGELGSDARDGKAGGFRRQRRGARHPRVHLDDYLPSALRVDGELDVGAAGLDADGAQDGERRIAHHLVFFVGERLDGRDGDRIASVHAHGVDVFDAANDDAVVVFIADYFEFVFFPADERFVDEHRAHRRQLQALGADGAKFIHVGGDAAAAATERERGPDDARQADALQDLLGFFKVVDDTAARDFQADLRHALVEEFALFSFFDSGALGAD